jgi:hypothetical protein
MLNNKSISMQRQICKRLAAKTKQIILKKNKKKHLNVKDETSEHE